MHYHFSSIRHSSRKRYVFLLVVLIVGLIIVGYFDSRAPRYIKFIGPKKIEISLHQASLDFTINVTNVSDKTYLQAEGYFLSGRIFTKDYSKEVFRLDNYSMDEIKPGEKSDMIISFNHNLDEGHYKLQIDAVHEGNNWFYDKGNTPLNINLRVE